MSTGMTPLKTSGESVPPSTSSATLVIAAISRAARCTCVVAAGGKVKLSLAHPGFELRGRGHRPQRYMSSQACATYDGADLVDSVASSCDCSALSSLRSSSSSAWTSEAVASYCGGGTSGLAAARYRPSVASSVGRGNRGNRCWLAYIGRVHSARRRAASNSMDVRRGRVGRHDRHVKSRKHEKIDQYTNGV